MVIKTIEVKRYVQYIITQDLTKNGKVLMEDIHSGCVKKQEGAVIEQVEVVAEATINGYLRVIVINVNLKNNTLAIDVGV